MRNLGLALTVTLTIAVCAPAGAADVPAPLRTLVYSVDYASNLSTEEKTSGLGDSGGMAGPQHAEHFYTEGDAGRLTVEVIGATGDGGLVVDAAFSGKTLQQPKIRVAIFPDGRLSFDPSKTLSQAGVRVLPLLARGIVAGREMTPGTNWKIDVPPPAKGSLHYNVTDVQGSVASLSIDGDISVSGPKGLDEHDHVAAKYAFDRLCPISYDLQAHIHRQQSPAIYVDSITHVTAKLDSDTFAK